MLAQQAEGEVKPRVFFDGFPDLTLYVRDIPPTGGWNDVFMADNTPGRPQAIYLVRHGRVILDPKKRTVEMVLEDGTRHVANADGTYQVVKFDRQVVERQRGIGVSARRADARRPRDDDLRLAGARRGA